MAAELIPVKVAVRCRPLVPKEIAEGCRAKIDFYEEYQQISLPDFEKAFTFDNIFPPSATQEDVYKTCGPDLLKALFNGYNATILAYGQTGSGKTFTMGTAYANDSNDNPIGIIPRVIEDLFRKLESEKWFYTVKVSFLEVYNEDIYDLFSPTRECIAVREDLNGIKVSGMQEIVVKDKDEVLKHLCKGSSSRQTGATKMNKVSSRSHALFTITVQLTNDKNTTTSKFHLVDLAGSEKAKKTGAQGDRFKEGVNINKGLFALGNVISALCDKSLHVPYRDSRLTRLLQDSLGGNSHTIMIACISPADSNLEETLNTLRYADRARKIKNRPIVNVAQDQKELEELKQKYNVLQSTWSQHMEMCQSKKTSKETVPSAETKNSISKATQTMKVTENSVPSHEAKNLPLKNAKRLSPQEDKNIPSKDTKSVASKENKHTSFGEPKRILPKVDPSDPLSLDPFLDLDPIINKRFANQNMLDTTYNVVLQEEDYEDNNSSTDSPDKRALRFEVDNLLKTNQQLIFHWTESNHAVNAYAKKLEQMDTKMNDWKLHFEELTEEIRNIGKEPAESGMPVLPKIMDIVAKFSEANVYNLEPLPEATPIMPANPEELLDIQKCLKDLEESLFEKQTELLKQKAMTEDLRPLQKIAEEQKDLIQQLEKERKELEDCLKKNPLARISEDRRKKISELEKQVNLLKKQLELNQKALKNKDCVEKKVKSLSNEIMMLKQSKVSMQKRHEQIKKQMREEKLKAAQQSAQASKKVNSLMCANQKLETRKKTSTF